MTCDLLLGSDLGLWALDQVERAQVGHVVTLDADIAAAAAERGLPVLTGHVDELDYRRAARAFSVHYPRLLGGAEIARRERVYNLHPALLPYGRGFYPVFWALWEGTPAGATLHEITPGIDDGPLVAQVEVPYGEADTGATLHARVRDAERELFTGLWPAIAGGEPLRSTPQPAGGTYHARREFLELRDGDAWRSLDAAALLRLARCLSFPGHPGLAVELAGRRFRLSLDEVA